MSTPTAISHWIDGRLQEGASGRVGPVYNPATGVQTGAVALADESEAHAAIASAVAAAQGWRETSLAKRTAILFAFRELLHANIDELAASITSEHGKVLSDAAGEIMRGLENVEYATGISHLLKGDHSEQVSTGVDVHSTRQPLGVVAGVTPFNFPVMVPLWMCANAIACGNAFILKPSEKDPSPALLIAELWKRAGLPDGIFTVLNGDKAAVDVLLRHPDIAAISFVGSTPIARSIYETGTAHGKRVQAVGGAKNHALILPDADLDMAADAIVSSAYGSAGERCMALSVAVAVGDMGDRIVEAVAKRLPGLTIGHGDCEGTDIGPLMTREHRDRVAGYIGAGEEAGAVVVHDGRESAVPADGYFLGTTLLDHVRPEMTVYTDEIFGPVLSVVRVDTYAEGMALINSNEFANGAVIFTQNGGAARQFEFDVHVGMVGVNVPVPVPVSYYSFGGWKASLFGDNHMYGPEGVQFYTRGKVVTTRWPSPGTSEIDLGFPRTR